MRLLHWLPGRLLSAIVVLLGASILIFAAVRSLPGDFAQIVLGPLSNEEQREQLRQSFGFDRSLPEQYLLWLGNAARGDFGLSLASQQPVLDELASRLPVTALLAGMAMLVTIAIGIPLGVYAGTHASTGRGSAAARIVSTIGISFPEFVLGCLVVFLFSRFDLGLSVGAFTSPTTDFGRGVVSLLLPALVLSVFCVAATARTTRDAVIGVLVEPHIAASVARGEPKGFIIRHHVLRNALIPVLTLTATITAYLLGGAVIVERVFNVPGIGSYLVLALDRRDYTVIQAGVLLATAVFVIASLLIDVLTGLVDPRVSVAKKGRGA
ncbi:ABC transporter permease [Agromyces soli]|uniref:ABC transporter permease n=1 Tax=Agromyces soli TaxID=659012 RepID=A0ABY4AUV7_9MICO|nr:ABC transporter permease [Agromyces soli]UOE26594.1 ABC transporter permease [Agromyces soli]